MELCSPTNQKGFQKIQMEDYIKERKQTVQNRIRAANIQGAIRYRILQKQKRLSSKAKPLGWVGLIHNRGQKVLILL